MDSNNRVFLCSKENILELSKIVSVNFEGDVVNGVYVKEENLKGVKVNV